MRNGNRKTVIIAEAGVNHCGSLKLALEMVDVAADAGADVVKFQTFRAKQVVSYRTPKADYQVRTTGQDESMLEMAQKLELDTAAHEMLIYRCNERGIAFLSSPFDLESLRFLADDLNLPLLKIASGEITNFPLLLAAARFGKNLIISTGMSTLGEIEAALGVLAYGYISTDTPNGSADIFRQSYTSKLGQEALQEHVTLLHCTSEYPVDFTDVNLRAMSTMKEAFALPVGLSDHTLGLAIPIAAVALGATTIEKHFTLDNKLPGPDHSASLDPVQLREMVRSIRQVEQGLGQGLKLPTASELKNLPIVRRSLTASCPIAKGELLTSENMTTKRPGNGVSATQYWIYLGKKAGRSYQEDDHIEVQ